MPISVEVRVPKKFHETPYGVLELDYWKQPREVCVVDEINCLPREDAEVICGFGRKNEVWVRKLAARHGFTVERDEGRDGLGSFVRLVVRRKEREKP